MVALEHQTRVSCRQASRSEQIHEHVRQPTSGGPQGVQWRAFVQSPMLIERR
jgi:hypothetical protein